MENHETNLLNIINRSLEVVYCGTILSNNGVIRFKRLISQFDSGLWNVFCQLFIFDTLNQWSNI